MDNLIHLYILVRESNGAFLGAYATLKEAEQMAKVFRVPTEILPWKITQQPLPAFEGSVLCPGR